MHQQKGMTLVAMLLTVAMVTFAGILVMRVVPVYLQHYSVMSSVRALDKLPASEFSLNPAANIAILKKALIKHLDINGVDDNVKDGIQFKADGPNKYKAIVKYQAVRSLLYNISLLFNFDESEEVTIGQS